MKDYVFVIWLIIVLLGVLSFMFAPMILEKRWNRKRDKERAENRKKANDKLAELFPLAIEEMKKKWKDITDDSVTRDDYSTRCRFYYKGFYFYLYVNDIELVEIHRDSDKVGTIAFDNVKTYMQTLGQLFNEADGIQYRSERVMNRLVNKLSKFHNGENEWKFIRDIPNKFELVKVLENSDNFLTLYIWERHVSAKIEKDGKVWASFGVTVNEDVDQFEAMNKVYNKIVQWEEFM